MDTPLELFLQGIISEKSAEFSGLKDDAQFVIVVDNPRARATRSAKPLKSVLDGSCHSHGNNRWSADTGDIDGQSPIRLPRPAPSPQIVLRKRKGQRNLMRKGAATTHIKKNAATH
jgi:hypothetical protein